MENNIQDQVKSPKPLIQIYKELVGGIITSDEEEIQEEEKEREFYIPAPFRRK